MKAVHTVRSVVDYYVSQNTTVIICALNLSKAFDKINHHGLFIKLMERHVPTNPLAVIEEWFVCHKWGKAFFRVFTRDSIYAIAHICHGNSVCPYVCHTGGSVKSV